MIIPLLFCNLVAPGHPCHQYELLNNWTNAKNGISKSTSVTKGVYSGCVLGLYLSLSRLWSRSLMSLISTLSVEVSPYSLEYSSPLKPKAFTTGTPQKLDSSIKLELKLIVCRWTFVSSLVTEKCLRDDARGEICGERGPGNALLLHLPAFQGAVVEIDHARRRARKRGQISTARKK